MTESPPKTVEEPEEMEGVRTRGNPALVSRDSRAPLTVVLPESAVAAATPDDIIGTGVFTGGAILGMLAAREARNCGYRPRKVTDAVHEPGEYVVTLEVDGDV